MRITLILTAGLLLLTVPFLTGCGDTIPAIEKNVIDDTGPASGADRVELVYFHTEEACHCMSVVEENIKYAVDTYFKEEVTGGKVKLTAIVSDDPGNAALVKEYDAMLFTLFIKEVRGNNEKVYPVSEIWNMTGDDNRDKLVQFIRNKIVEILGVEGA
ncbi:MAG: hypothetical protein JXA01_09045 [Dehalococcoidia bacterium]|nr:hypothetical protein [Dehalococcoidia bacterium]